MKRHKWAALIVSALVAVSAAAPCFAAKEDDAVIRSVHTTVDVHVDGTADVRHELSLSFADGAREFSMDFSAGWDMNGGYAEDLAAEGCEVSDDVGRSFTVTFDAAALAGQDAEAVVSYRYVTYDDLEPERDLMVLPLFSFYRSARVESLTAEITLPEGLTPQDVRAASALDVALADAGTQLGADISARDGVVTVETSEVMQSWDDLSLVLEFAPGELGARGLGDVSGVVVTSNECEVDVSPELEYTVRQSVSLTLDPSESWWSVYLPVLETTSGWDGAEYSDFTFEQNAGAEWSADEYGLYVTFRSDENGAPPEGEQVFVYTYTMRPARADAADEQFYVPETYGAGRTDSLRFVLRAPTLTGVRTFFSGILATSKSERFDVVSSDGEVVVVSKGPVYEGEYLELTPQWDADAFGREAVRGGGAALALSAALAAVCLALAVRARRARRMTPGAPSPEPPEGVTCAEAGYLCDGVVSAAELGTLAVAWAAEGAASLRETPGGVVLTRLAALPDGASAWERELFDAVFARGAQVSARTPGAGARAAAAGALRAVRASFRSGERALILPSSARRARALTALACLIPGFAALASCLELGRSPAEALALGAACAALSVPAAVCAFAAAARSFALAQSPGRAFVRAVLAVPAFGFASAPALALERIGVPVTLAGCVAVCAAACAALAARTLAPSPRSIGVLEHLDALARFLAAASPKEAAALLADDPNAFYRLLPYAISMGLYDAWVDRFDGLYVQINTAFEGVSDHEEAARLAARTVLDLRAALR